MRYDGGMKTAQLPPVRIEPSVREEIEGVLRDGESLSQFVETATIEAARRRRAQDEFLARGRASLAKAKRTGKFHSAQTVLGDLQGRMEAAVQTLRQGKKTGGSHR